MPTIPRLRILMLAATMILVSVGLAAAQSRGSRSARSRSSAIKAQLATELNNSAVFPPGVRMRYEESSFRIRTRLEAASSGSTVEVRRVRFSVPSIGLRGTVRASTSDSGRTDLTEMQLRIPWNTPASQ